MKGGILCSTQMEFKAITNGRENAKVEKPRGGGIYINSCNRMEEGKDGGEPNYCNRDLQSFQTRTLFSLTQ